MGLFRRSNFVFNTLRNVGSKAPSIASRFGYLNVLKQNKSSFLGSVVSRRYYCVDRNRVRGYRKWFQNRKNVFSVVVVGFGVVISFCFGGIEVVPYTNRKQFLIMFKQTGGGESDLGGILPPTHPYSVRASLIGKNIFDALHQGLRNEQVSSDSNYAMNEKPKYETLKSEEVFVKENRRQEEKKWAKPSTHHLKRNGLSFE